LKGLKNLIGIGICSGRRCKGKSKMGVNQNYNINGMGALNGVMLCPDGVWEDMLAIGMS
jgi:hypothetical protein